MALCSDVKAAYCCNACCYIKWKPVRKNEVPRIGLENIVFRGNVTYLRNQPGSNACVFLDVEEGRCKIYEKRPDNCAIFSCLYNPYIQPEGLIQEAFVHQRRLKEGR